MRQLVVLDDYDAAALERMSAGPAAGEPIDVLLLGLSNEWFAWQYRGLDPARWRVIDQRAFAAEATQRVREFVVPFIAGLPRQRLGGTTLFELLSDPGRTDVPDVNEWWFTETSEKGPYRGPFVGQCYRLAMLRLVVEHQPYTRVWYGLRDVALHEAVSVTAAAGAGIEWTALPCERVTHRPPLTEWPLVRYWAQALRSVAWLAGAKLLCWWLARVSRSTATVVEGAEVTYTEFPAWWFDVESERPRDRFFSPRDSRQPPAYIAWLSEPRRLWGVRRQIARAFVRQRIVPLQKYIGLGDVRHLLSLRYFGRVVAFERRLRADIRAEFCGFNVGALAGREVSASLSGAEPFLNRLLVRAAARAAEDLRPSTVVYRAEFQPREHALVRGVSATQALTAGFVHFPFGERYLSMRFSPSEIAGAGPARADPDRRPMPDGILAIGSSAARHAADGGFPRERIAVCGPQRYGGLVEAVKCPRPRAVLRQELGLPADAFVVVAAFAIVESDTEALCAALGSLAAVENVHVVIRTHPNQPRAKRAITTLLDTLGSTRASVMPPGGSVYGYIAASNMMVCVGSMIAFEAMAVGVMPMVFENPSTYAATSLAEYEAGLFVARNGAELVEGIEAVRINSDVARRKHAEWANMIADVLGDFDRPLGVQMDAAIDTIRQGAGK